MKNHKTYLERVLGLVPIQARSWFLILVPVLFFLQNLELAIPISGKGPKNQNQTTLVPAVFSPVL
jgi:hypothetical protein